MKAAIPEFRFVWHDGAWEIATPDGPVRDRDGHPATWPTFAEAYRAMQQLESGGARADRRALVIPLPGA